jgi:hypothetical protein
MQVSLSTWDLLQGLQEQEFRDQHGTCNVFCDSLTLCHIYGSDHQVCSDPSWRVHTPELLIEGWSKNMQPCFKTMTEHLRSHLR